MKRRKGYRRKNGHRQGFTELLIEDVLQAGGTRQKRAKSPTGDKESAPPASAKTDDAAAAAEAPVEASEEVGEPATPQASATPAEGKNAEDEDAKAKKTPRARSTKPKKTPSARSTTKKE